MLHIIIITKKKKTFAGKGIRLNLLNDTTTTNVAGRKNQQKKFLTDVLAGSWISVD